MHGNIKNLRGQTFGDLTVIELTDLKLPSRRSSIWKCRCSCGNICYKTSGDLRDSRRKTCSCGCKSRANRQFPNKFVPNEPLLTQQKCIDKILTYFADKPYIEELKTGMIEIFGDEKTVSITRQEKENEV